MTRDTAAFLPLADMPLFRDLTDLGDCRGGVVAIGNFDGVHLGHRSMIAELRRRADAAGVRALAVTFDPPPVELLRPEQAPPRLTSLERKAELLEAAGADCVLALPTDLHLLGLSAEAFFDDLLVGRLVVRGLVEGPNFRFGRDRAGDVTLLEALCERAGLSFQVVEPVHVEGRMVSSSLVREMVAQAELRAAAAMLGRFHEAVGVVERGADRGKTLGFPTANLGGVVTLLPPDGVYAGRTDIDGRTYAAAIHLGPNSTFGETRRTVEAHLLDFAGDLYGRLLRIELIERIRDTARFDGPAALVAQLEADCRRVRPLVATASAGG